MLSHCQPKGEMSERGQQEEASREEEDVSTACHLGSPVTPRIFKNQLPTPKAHRKLESATDVWINSDAL